jgi:WD40 repeat protein
VALCSSPMIWTSLRKFSLVCSLLLLTALTIFAQPSQPRAELVVQTGHTEVVMSIKFSPDGRTLASEGDGTIKLWDARSGQELRTLEGGHALVFNPDGKTFTTVMGSSSKTIKLWDIESGQELRTVTMSFTLGFPLAFSADGKTVASLGLNLNLDSKKPEYMIKLGDAQSGQELRSLTFNEGSVVALAFSPDGKIIASKSLNQTITLWDVQSGQVLHTLKGSIGVRSLLVFSPGGETLASDSDHDAIKLWNVQTGQELRTLAGLSFGNYALAFSPDGKMLACGGAGRTGSVKLWEVESGQELRTLTGQPISTYSLAFSPDGKMLAGGANKTMSLWDVQSGRELYSLEGHAAGAYWLAASPNGKVLAKGGGGIVRLWSLPSFEELPTLEDYPNSVTPLAFSPDGTMLASDSVGRIKLWDLGRGQELRTLEGHTEPVNLAEFSPDGKIIASGSYDNTIRLWNTQNGQELHTLKGHTDKISSLAFSRDGKIIASGSNDDTVKLWDVGTGNELHTLTDTYNVSDLAFSPDNRIIASVSALEIVLWDVSTGSKLQATFGKGRVVFSPDGKVIASHDIRGGVMLWDIASGESSPSYKRVDPRSIRAVTALVPDFYRMNYLLSADGKWRFDRAPNGRIDVSEFETGELRVSLFTFGKQDWLAVTPDGFFDGSPGAWKRVIWRLDNNTFRYAPVEAFFTDFFHPGLLQDLLNGKLPKTSVDISRKDIRQPKVIAELADENLKADNIPARKATIKVTVIDAPPDERHPNKSSGAQDVRLFRNGSLVKVWRGDVLKGQSSATLGATIPVIAGENRLTAYAFNHDNVKSTDATLVVNGAESLKRQGTAYILAVGINNYSNSQYNLKYAVADALDFSAEVKRQQELLKRYAQVEVISLSDTQATKADITQKLTQLATRVQPEDAVIIYFAGHGTAQGNQFYLIPHDLGYRGPRQTLSKAGLQTILDHSISDRELEKLFEGIDAGQLLLVIDACNSGQALEAEEKRRGPMNSKGLAQLAYEKGMYVLTAAQSYQAAKEAKKFGHGFLTYALIEEGLKQGAADREPKNGTIDLRKWLNYATEEVPKMQEQNSLEALRGRGRYLVFVGDGSPPRNVGLNVDARDNIQRPRLFYRREADSNPLVVAVLGATSPQ